MSRSAEELAARGWTLLPEPLDAAATAGLVCVLDRLRAEVGDVPLCAREDRRVAEGATISPVGLTFSGVLDRAPELDTLLLVPGLVALLREVLGDALELELTCAVISDETRPFFFWHNHVGGIDGEDFRGRLPPPPARLGRLVCTFYATPLDERHGVMLAHPRAVGEPLAAPHPRRDAPWPDAEVVRAPAGSVLVLDEATWHAVTPMQAPGLRRFVAGFVRAAGAPPTRRVDPSIARALAIDARLAAVYRAAPTLDRAAPRSERR